MQIWKKAFLLIKRNPLNTTIVAFCMLLAYGFYATHYTYHIDQLVFEYYDGTALITAGRFVAPLIHFFTNWMAFSPFWHTIAMCLLLFLASMLWAALFQQASGDILSDSGLFVFTVAFTTFPITAYQLTYPILNIALAYALVPISLFLLFFDTQTTRFHAWRNHILAILLLVLAVDMYESFASVFLVGLFAILLLQVLFLKNQSIGKLFKTTVFAFVLLLCAILVDFLVSKMLCYLFTGSFTFWHGVTTEIGWLSMGVFDCFIWLVRTFTAQFVLGHTQSLSIFLVMYSVLASIVVACILWRQKKDAKIPLLFIFLSFSVFSLDFVTGIVHASRTFQSSALFVAFFIMLLWHLTRAKAKSILRSFSICMLCLLILLQTQSINHYSVKNYNRHQYEEEILREIALTLPSFPITEKPVAFVCEEGYALPNSFARPQDTHPLARAYRSAWFFVCDSIFSNSYYQKLSDWYGTSITCANDLFQYQTKAENAWSYSFINHAVSATHYTPEIYRTMQMLGTTLLPCSSEQYQNAKLCTIQQALWIDNSFYITEQDDLIIVCFIQNA